MASKDQPTIRYRFRNNTRVTLRFEEKREFSGHFVSGPTRVVRHGEIGECEIQPKPPVGAMVGMAYNEIGPFLWIMAVHFNPQQGIRKSLVDVRPRGSIDWDEVRKRLEDLPNSFAEQSENETNSAADTVEISVTLEPGVGPA